MKTSIKNTIQRIFHIHWFKPILSRYLSFGSREILYECKCGKRKLVTVYRNFDDNFPIQTTTLLTHSEMQKAFLNGIKK